MILEWRHSSGLFGSRFKKHKQSFSGAGCGWFWNGGTLRGRGRSGRSSTVSRVYVSNRSAVSSRKPSAPHLHTIQSPRYTESPTYYQSKSTGLCYCHSPEKSTPHQCCFHTYVHGVLESCRRTLPKPCPPPRNERFFSTAAAPRALGP